MALGPIQQIKIATKSIKRLLLDTDTREQIRASIAHTNCQPSLRKCYQHLSSMEKADQFNQFCLSRSKAELRQFLQNKVTLSSPDYWQQVSNFDGPVIFVTPHYGPFTIGCLKAVFDMGENKTINAFYDSPEKNPTTAIYKDVLNALGENFNPIYNDKRGLVRAIKCLKNKEIVTMMPDVFDLSGQSISVPFFGHFTTAMAGTAFLALKTNALIMQGYCVPTKSGGVNCVLEQPFQYQQTTDFEQDVYQLTSRLFLSMEKQISEAPEHWIYLRQLRNRLGLPLPQSENFNASKNKILAVVKNLNMNAKEIEDALNAFSNH